MLYYIKRDQITVEAGRGEGCCWEEHDRVFPPKEQGRFWKSAIEKWLDAVSRAQWVILVGIWKAVGMRAMWTVETQLKRFHGRTIFASGLETIFIYFDKKNLVFFCPYPKNLPEAKFKSIGLISWQEDLKTT